MAASAGLGLTVVYNSGVWGWSRCLGSFTQLMPSSHVRSFWFLEGFNSLERLCREKKMQARQRVEVTVDLNLFRTVKEEC